jgi:hypothetical protein
LALVSIAKLFSPQHSREQVFGRRLLPFSSMARLRFRPSVSRKASFINFSSISMFVRMMCTNVAHHTHASALQPLQQASFTAWRLTGRSTQTPFNLGYKGFPIHKGFPICQGESIPNQLPSAIDL